MREDYLKVLKRWILNSAEDEDLVKELKQVMFNEEEVYDRFYKDLEFGTAGMRGILGAGTNRMNLFVVSRMTQAFCEYLKKNYDKPSVAISYDSRNKSDLFAKKAAEVFAANGILVYFFKHLAPVPTLSFVVRNLKCSAGLMITASHNPAEYNGYKVYGLDGAQLGEKEAEEIFKISTKLDVFDDVKTLKFNKELEDLKIVYVKKEIIEKYCEQVINFLIHKEVLNEEKNLKVIYTPLNGSGCEYVKNVFSRLNFKNYNIVKEQEKPDGNFTTCKYPNPETKQAFDLAIKYAVAQKADLLIATDPDCDRVGVAVLDERKNEYVILNGNEIGTLMFNYLCEEKTKLGVMPKNPVAVKTIVSSNLVLKLAKAYGVEMKNVYTGFKNIGEQIAILEKNNEQQRFIFAFEESHGYLAGDYVRDKDGVFAAVFVCEIVAFYKQQKISILDVLENIYEKYGFYKTKVESFVFNGEEGTKKMKNIMKNIRNTDIEKFGSLAVYEKIDYYESLKYDVIKKTKEKIDFKKSDTLQFNLEKEASIIIRPSGTEPKIKIYFSAAGKTKKESNELIKMLVKSFDVNGYI